ncbi:porin family protein [Thiotrichales bacterium 19S9-12]|nr:porin family protein [Thiotrichales bacterium 19S9-11]MCF6811688.1 porin family protein [Thiotrichales bacterium 19S9-12]
MKRYIKPLAALCLISLAGTATADNHQSNKLDLVVGGKLGYGYLSAKDYTGVDKKDGGVYTGAFVGVDYYIMPNLTIGGETGLDYGSDLLKYDTTGIDVEVNDTYVVPLLATIKYFMPYGINVYGKAGIAYVNQKLSAHLGNVGSGSTDTTLSRWNGMLGGGIGYKLDSWNFFVEYMYVMGDKDPQTKSSTFPINTITGGVSYTFPM